MPQVRLLVRTDIDWTAMRPESFANQTESERPLGFIRFAVERRLLERWREAFGSEYFDFRAALQAIARRNLESAGATVSRGLQDFATWYDSDDDELIFPIDDDDVFDPDLPQVASRMEDPLVIWPHYQYTYDDQGHPILRRLPFMVLLSNNWGIRKSFLKRHFSVDEARGVLADHKKATLAVARACGVEVPAPDKAWFAFHLASPSIRHLSEPHGLSVKHIGSLVALKQALAQDDPIRALRNQRVAGHADVPAEMEWARPWVQQYEDVLGALGRKQ